MRGYTRKLLESFEGEGFANTFEMPEKGFNDRFNKIKLPWYLRLFRKQIRCVCASYVNLSKFDSKEKLITIKRPHQYSSSKKEG